MNFFIKKIIPLILVVMLIEEVKAQTLKNDLVINIGGYSGYGYNKLQPFTGAPVIPVSSLGSEYFLSNHISIGSYVAYTYDYDIIIDSKQRNKDIWRGWDIGIKPTLHFNPFLSEQLKKTADIYIAGFGGYAYRALRYHKSNIYRDELNYDVDGLNIGGILGFRYLLSNKVSLYGELGKSSRWFAGGGIAFTIKSK